MRSLTQNIAEGRDVEAIAEQILQGGCAALQLRAKSISDRDFVELAHALRTLCTSYQTPFVVNDRPDIAKLVDANGVSFGPKRPVDLLCSTGCRIHVHRTLNP